MNGWRMARFQAEAPLSAARGGNDKIPA